MPYEVGLSKSGLKETLNHCRQFVCILTWPRFGWRLELIAETLPWITKLLKPEYAMLQFLPLHHISSLELNSIPRAGSWVGPGCDNHQCIVDSSTGPWLTARSEARRISERIRPSSRSELHGATIFDCRRVRCTQRVHWSLDFPSHRHVLLYRWRSARYLFK
mgnify:CR=1 FL=1